MKAVFMNEEGELSIVETAQAGLAGIPEDVIEALDAGEGLLVRFNEDHYESACVSSEEEDDEVVYELTWELVG